MICGLKPAATRCSRIRGELHSERYVILRTVQNEAVNPRLTRGRRRLREKGFWVDGLFAGCVRCSIEAVSHSKRLSEKKQPELQGDHNRVQLGTNQVGEWRQRWQKEFERLTRIEGTEEPIQLRRAIEELLSDEHRSGRKPTFTAEQLTMIFAVACEAVEESGRPVARWTLREIVDEVIKRGIVPYISKSHMNTLLIEAQLQPHKSRYWLNTKEKDPEVFQQQMQTVCECYQQAPELMAQFDTHTICSAKHTLVGQSRAVGHPDGRPEALTGRSRRERESGDSEEPKVAAGVSDSSRTSHSFHLRAEAQFVAESGGDLV
ncbi:MAG TPA: hypothetical protein PLY87_31035 [Planctomycetaceae bacterium]|nr:hypothetical protein [Planctomycetaceae bacterium]